MKLHDIVKPLLLTDEDKIRILQFRSHFHNRYEVRIRDSGVFLEYNNYSPDSSNGPDWLDLRTASFHFFTGRNVDPSMFDLSMIQVLP